MRETCQPLNFKKLQFPAISYPLRSVKGLIHLFWHSLYPHYLMFQENRQHASGRLLFIDIDVAVHTSGATLSPSIDRDMVFITRELMPPHLVLHDISLDLFSQTLDMSSPPLGLYFRITPDRQPEPCWK